MADTKIHQDNPTSDDTAVRPESRHATNEPLPLAEQARRVEAERIRREKLLADLHRLQAQVSARNADLTDEQADALADEISRDAINELIRKGRIRYADDSAG